MQRWILSLSAVMIGFAMAPVALAQRPDTSAPRPNTPAPPQNGRFGSPDSYARVFQDYLYGVVAKVHRGSLVLDKTKFGVPKTIEVNRKTKFVRSGKRSSLAKLKLGDMVFVQTKKDKKTGGLIAKKVVSGMGGG
jgi:hypothetical protein